METIPSSLGTATMTLLTLTDQGDVVAATVRERDITACATLRHGLGLVPGVGRVDPEVGVDLVPHARLDSPAVARELLKELGTDRKEPLAGVGSVDHHAVRQAHPALFVGAV